MTGGRKLAQPRPTTEAATLSRAARTVTGDEVGLKIRVTATLHRQVKVRIAEQGLSLQDYVTRLIEADLAKRGGVG